MSSLGRDPVLLEVVDGPDLSDAMEGWQKPTKDTGYGGPLEVRYLVMEGGSVTAMTRSDVVYWTVSNTDPEFGLAPGFGGLALAGLSLAANSARLTRLTRLTRLERRRTRPREHRRMARRAAMGRKKPDLDG